MKRSKKSAVFTVTILTLVVFLQVPVLKAQVGINQPNPDSSAVLDLKSNNRGVLMPRLTAAEIQSIPTPSKGLMVYCSDLSVFCYFDGTDWLSLPSWVQKLDLADPAGGIQDINAILNANSKVGVGTDTPANKLTVTGNVSIGDNAAAPVNGAYIKGKVKIGNPPDAGDTQQLEVDGNINAEGNITATGNMNTTGKVQENGNDLLPKGAIIMWSGTSPPDGWALCDGTIGPDLRGRFIVGYHNSDTDYNQPGNYSSGDGTDSIDNGGEKKHTLTKAEMPAHNHDNSASPDGRTANDTHKHGWAWKNDSKDFDTDGSGTADRRITLGDQPDVTFEQDDINSLNSIMETRMKNNTHNHEIYPRGENKAHENRPPYYVLTFIIKL